MKVLGSRGNIFAHDEPNPTFCKCARKSVCARLFVYHRPCPVVLSARRGCCIALSVVPPSGGPSFNSPFFIASVFARRRKVCECPSATWYRRAADYTQDSLFNQTKCDRPLSPRWPFKFSFFPPRAGTLSNVYGCVCVSVFWVRSPWIHTHSDKSHAQSQRRRRRPLQKTLNLLLDLCENGDFSIHRSFGQATTAMPSILHLSSSSVLPIIILTAHYDHLGANSRNNNIHR